MIAPCAEGSIPFRHYNLFIQTVAPPFRYSISTRRCCATARAFSAHPRSILVVLPSEHGSSGVGVLVGSVPLLRRIVLATMEAGFSAVVMARWDPIARRWSRAPGDGPRHRSRHSPHQPLPAGVPEMDTGRLSSRPGFLPPTARRKKDIWEDLQTVDGAEAATLW